MISVDLTEFTNSSNWHIRHNEDSRLFEIVASNGTVKAGKFTDRKFAEAALYEYLSDVQKHNTSISSKASKIPDKPKEALAPISVEAVKTEDAPMLPLKRKKAPADWWKKND